MRKYLLILAILLLSTQAFAQGIGECTPLDERVCTDYSEREIDGFKVTKCWKYEQKFRCIGAEHNYCQILEGNRGCNEVSGECLEKTESGLCKHFEKKFICGNKYQDSLELKRIETAYNIIRDEKDFEGCAIQEKDKLCQVIEEKCVEGAGSRNIDGKEVYKECWKWERQYLCESSSLIDECGELKEKCKEASKECVFEDDGQCKHYQVKYECTEEKVKNINCIASQFCLNGVCDTKKRTQYNDFGEGISYLSVLANMKSKDTEGCRCPNGKSDCDPSEIDPKTCKFFTGNSGECRRNTSQGNCCSYKGFLRKLIGCEDSEKKLKDNRDSGLCHFVGEYCAEKLFGIKKLCRKRKESYCCFGSKLAKIFQVQGRAQLGIGWGSAKSPDCRALTLDEIQRIDFSRINFSEIFNEMQEQAEKAAMSKVDEFKGQVQGLKDNPNFGAELINKKISKFYESK